MEEYKELTKKLTEQLEKQKDFYEAINELSELKTNVILRRDIVELDKIVEAEQLLLIKTGEAERRREEITLELAKKLGCDNSLTMSKLVTELKQNETDTLELEKVSNELKICIEKQKQYNKTNMRLIENNLNYIKDVIQKVVIGDKKEKTYSESGKHRMTQKQYIIDESV